MRSLFFAALAMLGLGPIGAHPAALPHAALLHAALRVKAPHAAHLAVATGEGGPDQDTSQRWGQVRYA